MGSPDVYDEDSGTWVHAAAISNPSGGATIDAEARTAINSILTALRSANILAGD